MIFKSYRYPKHDKFNFCRHIYYKHVFGNLAEVFAPSTKSNEGQKNIFVVENKSKKEEEREMKNSV